MPILTPVIRPLLSVCNRYTGSPDKREATVCDVDAYNGITAYLAELEATPVETLDDIIAYNDEHAVAEGANPGENPAFPSGQVRRKNRLLSCFRRADTAESGRHARRSSN